MMTVREMIDGLRAERRQLDAALATLEQLEARQRASVQSYPGKRRGRKSMGREERAEVSRRMRAYWAAQRKARGAA